YWAQHYALARTRCGFVGWIFDGFEAFSLFLVLPLMLKSLLTPEQAATPAFWAGVAIGVTLFGWGIGGVVGGMLTDYIGRKRMMDGNHAKLLPVTLSPSPA